MEQLFFSRSQDLISWQHIYKRGYFIGLNNTLLSYDLCVYHNNALLRFHISYGSYIQVYSTTDGMTWTNPVPAGFPANSSLKKIISHDGALYAFMREVYAIEVTVIRKSVDNGLSWSVLVGIGAAFVDCGSTADGILVVTANKETWIVSDQGLLTKKNYSLPSSSMTDGHLVALGADLFMLGCGPSYNTAFKLVGSAAPVGTPL